MKKYSILLAGSLALLLSSCLKDKNVDDGIYGMEGADKAKLAELASDDASHLKSFAFDFKDEVLDVKIVEVRLTSRDLPTQPVTVTLSMTNGPTLISDWNADNGTSYSLMPANLYTITGGLDVTIPAGERVGYLTIKTNPINYNPSVTYALGFEIASISDASYKKSGNFGTMIVTFGAKNSYDGLYEITGTLTDANGLYVGDYGDPAYPRQYELITTGAQTAIVYDRSWDYPYYIVINATTGGAATTNIRPRLTFEPGSGVISNVTNVGTSAAVITVQPGSKFNASDRSIDLRWIAGRWDVNEHWEYIGPR